MKVRCIRNDSKCLPFYVGAIYRAVDIGGIYEIRDGQGSAIFAHLDGHYLDFVKVPEKNKG